MQSLAVIGDYRPLELAYRRIGIAYPVIACCVLVYKFVSSVSVHDKSSDYLKGGGIVSGHIDAAVLISSVEYHGEIGLVGCKDDIADVCASFFGQHIEYIVDVGDVNVFSVNPDGSIGLSTIGYWRYMNNHEGGADATVTAGDWSVTKRGSGADQVVIQLTEGQNALNLYNAGVGAGSTLMVKLDDGFTYLLHLRITDIHVQEFTQEAYDAGEFASGYSGADRQARSFYFTFDVLSIEKTNQIL